MPAKNLYRTDEKGTYSHVYNKGIDKRILFNDQEDYEVFLGYLKNYLTAPANPESIKKTFTVNGRVFRGTPHQPKNYLGKVELMAYSLRPDHFHLLLHQKVGGSLESFIRSLSTRYSMYFNKKYERTGALFEGPYKSAQVKDEPRLLYLTHYLHHTGDYSSYAEYLGTREASWVKPKVILSFFDKAKTGFSKGTSGYKDFVEKYELNQEGKKLLEGIMLESEVQHLEGRDPVRNIGNYPAEVSTEALKVNPDLDLKPQSRIPELLGIATVFLLLVGLGIRNIKSSTAKSFNPPTTLGVSRTEEVKTEEIKPKVMVVIKIIDGAASVNIRQKPTIRSEKVGEAKDGETFEFVSIDSGWYEVKLADGSTGFISSAYIEPLEGTNE